MDARRGLRSRDRNRLGGPALRRKAALKAVRTGKGSLLTRNYLPHERKAFAEFILGDFLIGLGTASADSDSNSESVSYLNLIDALTPTLVWFNFFHLEGLLV